MSEHNGGQRVEIQARPMAAEDALLEVAANARAMAADSRELLRELLQEIRRPQPAKLTPIKLTQATPVVTDDNRDNLGPSLSFGVINPTAVPVVVGLAGGQATRLARGLVIPAQSLMVVPVRLDDAEIGVDPGDQAALAAGDVWVYLLRYRTLQPAFLGRAA